MRLVDELGKHRGALSGTAGSSLSTMVQLLTWPKEGDARLVSTTLPQLWPARPAHARPGTSFHRDARSPLPGPRKVTSSLRGRPPVGPFP